MPNDKKPDLSDWKRLAAEESGADPADLQRQNPEKVPIKPLYTLADLAGADVNTLPGFPPFTRGVRATMYANRPWTIRQYAGFSTAEESNKFFRECLAAGQMGLSVAFDLATHRGYDSDHPRAAADVGKAGVAIDTVEDMKILFDGIPLDRMSVSMTMNGAVLPVLAAFIVAAEENGVTQAQLTGTIQNDILKEFMVRNTYIYPPAPSMRIVADIIAHTARHMPKFNSISISGYHMHEAGATAVQELAFTLADGLEYVRTAIERGLKIDDFAPRLSFFFGIGMNFFMEIAKLRAARLLWAEFMEKNFGAKDPRSLMLRMHCQTSGASLAAQEPLNNIIRTSYEALAAVLGGTQSLHTNSYDEAISLPTPLAARVARNTQLILAEETGVTDTVDPLGGSYYVESLTRNLADAARKLMQSIERQGGMVKAIESGMPKRMIEEAAAARQAMIDRGDITLVGVNKYRPDDIKEIEILAIDNARVRRQQQARIRDVRAARDAAACTQALDALTAAAENGKGNLLELAIAAMHERCTVGEVSDALAKIFTRYETVGSAVSGIYGKIMEGDARVAQIREEIALMEKQRGRTPRVLVAKLGQDGHDRGQKIVAAAYSDMGFDVVLGALFQTPAEVAAEAIAQDVHVIGVSTLAGAHQNLVPELLRELRGRNAAHIIVVCGGVIPQQDHAALLSAGVAAIFGPGTPLPDAAMKVLRLITRRNEPE